MNSSSGVTHPVRDRVVVAHVHGGGLERKIRISHNGCRRDQQKSGKKENTHPRTPRPQADLRRVPIRPAHVHPARVALPEVADREERAAGLGAADEAGAGGAGAGWEVSRVLQFWSKVLRSEGGMWLRGGRWNVEMVLRILYASKTLSYASKTLTPG